MKRAPLFAVTGAGTGVPDVLHEITEPADDWAGGVVAEVPAPTATAVCQAERSIVGAILADNTLYDHVVERLRPDDFLDAGARLIYAAIGDIIEGRLPEVKVADAITLAMLPGVEHAVSLPDLQALVDQADPSLDVVSTRAKVVHDASAQRKLAAAAQRMHSIVGEDRPVEEKTTEIQSLLTSASETATLPLVSLGSAAVKALHLLAERAQSGQTGMGIPLGFADLDAMLAGLHGGQVIVLAARPGVGKTALALSAGLNMARGGWNVAMASMEMLAEELAKRALAIESGVDSHAIRLGALSESDWVDAVAAAERLEQVPFDIVGLPSVDLVSLSGLCRRRRRAGKLDVLIVDYLQIMKTLSPRLLREQQVAELSRGLKELAMALGIPVIVLSQLSRQLEQRIDRRPILSDLRESGAIEQDADVVLFVHRDDAPVAQPLSAQADSVAEIIVAKQRAGPTGVVEVIFRKRTTAFLDRQQVDGRLAAVDPLRLAA